jgi:hypothetical protein
MKSTFLKGRSLYTLFSIKTTYNLKFERLDGLIFEILPIQNATHTKKKANYLTHKMLMYLDRSGNISASKPQLTSASLLLRRLFHNAQGKNANNLPIMIYIIIMTIYNSSNNNNIRRV